MTRSSGFFRRTSAESFSDRRAAGRALAGRLTAYRDNDDVLVLGLARGGVPVGWEIAAALHAPLDVFVVRKLGAPQSAELAMGALASGGHVVFNENVVAGLRVDAETVQAVVERETVELHRREQAYRGGRPPPDLRGRVVLLVDDGIATGASMLVAVRAVRAAGPASIVVAVPVAPAAACRHLAGEADEVVAASIPAVFDAVGQAYADFHQIDDDEVRELLSTPTGGGR